MVLSVIAGVAVLLLIAAVIITRDGGGSDPEEPGEPGDEEIADDVEEIADVDGVVVGTTGVIGTWSGSDWQPREEGNQPGAGLDYHVVGVGDDVATASAEAVDDECTSRQDAPGRDVRVSLDGSPPPVAVAGVDNPRPRSVEYFESSETYVQAAAEVAQGQGATTPPTVTQVFRTDIDGDGTDEVVVAAEHISDPDGLAAAPGDWSIVFLRRVVGDGPVADVLAASVVGSDGDGALERIQVSTVADLNGDGHLEVVFNGRSGTGEWTAVQALAGDDMASGMAEVMRAGCEG